MKPTITSTASEANALFVANTAIVQHLERYDAFLASVVSEACRLAERRVSISAYIADIGSRAFSWHVDRWDNVIIQVQGNKRFELEGESYDLNPGDALFLPLDVLHRTETLERSVHLSIVFLPSLQES